MIVHWQAVFKLYQPRLVPNKKSTTQVIAYLRQKYPLETVESAAALAVVTGNISANRCFAEKCPPGKEI